MAHVGRTDLLRESKKGPPDITVQGTGGSRCSRSGRGPRS